MGYKYGVFFSTLQTEEIRYSRHRSYRNAQKTASRLNGIGQGLVARVKKLNAPKRKAPKKILWKMQKEHKLSDFIKDPKEYYEVHYDHIPLDYFSKETREKKQFEKVINMACKLSGWSRNPTDEEIAFCCFNQVDVKYYIAKAEIELGLRKEMPCLPGDNEYG